VSTERGSQRALTRNRPDRFATDDDAVGPSHVEHAFAAGLEQAVDAGQDPSAAAEAAYQGVTAGNFYIFTDAGFDDQINKRQIDINARRNPTR
jgi:hypothetical protein